MVCFASSLTYSQIVSKDGEKLKIQNPNIKSNDAIEQLDNKPLSINEVTRGYFYLLELQKLRNNYEASEKQITFLKQQNGAYQDKTEIQKDIIRNLESYAEQVKPEWWQSEIAIIAWVAGSIALTYLIVK